ncbi:molybdenum cofactor synthesis domain-containing protein [Natronincola peptidivorans]|uniref:Molybdopterin molybdenumtransferase n=1 Tax=Natronincola peptidivorans TaxID=426128 RepID=A0A1I0D9T7_9FIRM|nr:molybdopterin-binding protein [Natronincola peptidivorans]SET28299.1 molybdenum cofactor synthesis domain-containing protein [Natronincola peptidivorans]
MRRIKTQEAIGMVIGHDVTEIVPGEFKGAAFRKGHVIKKEDIEKLLRIGKEHIYAMELQEDELHEDEAALIIGELVCGDGVCFSDTNEGKINIIAKQKGLLKIDKELLYEINNLGDICLATIHGNRVIEKDGLLGGCRVIPLVIKKKKIVEIKKVLKGRGSLIEVKPFNELTVGLIITGSEVYKERIKDTFGPVIEKKMRGFHSKIVKKTIVPDEMEIIKKAILEYKREGLEFIIVTGGMSVDPDDKTPGAIKSTGADIISYGTPVLPGAMLLMSYLGDTPVLGLPGCVMFAHNTVFDLLLPRIFAGEKIVKRDIISLGYGGQCLKCNVCNFPNCHFGKC